MSLIQRLAGAEGRPFTALVSPSVRSLLPGAYGSLNAWLAEAGAASVLPVDAGIPAFAWLSAAAAVSMEKGSRGSGPSGPYVLSACPMALRFVRERFPAFAGRLLDVPSPMALLARQSLEAAGLLGRGLAGRGLALAVTPCSYKRLESAAGAELRVVELGELLAALASEGLDLADYPARGYDEPPWQTGEDCTLGQAVVEAAESLGFRARAVRLDGAAEAARYLGSSLPESDAASGELVFVDMSFCEGGCSKAADLTAGTARGAPLSARP